VPNSDRSLPAPTFWFDHRDRRPASNEDATCSSRAAVRTSSLLGNSTSCPRMSRAPFWRTGRCATRPVLGRSRHNPNSAVIPVALVESAQHPTDPERVADRPGALQAPAGGCFAVVESCRGGGPNGKWTAQRLAALARTLGGHHARRENRLGPPRPLPEVGPRRWAGPRNFMAETTGFGMIATAVNARRPSRLRFVDEPPVHVSPSLMPRLPGGPVAPAGAARRARAPRAIRG